MEDSAVGGRLPNVVVIGAMKAGTTALHRYLDRHPDIAMSQPKELNFFFGPPSLDTPSADAQWHEGNWWRGRSWYASQFPQNVAFRGESSPGYTSPSHTEAPQRMAETIPDARLVYVVRAPIDRAVSQYRHHQREGSETRPIGEALTDPASQYIARGRYYERLEPFLRFFPPSQIAVVDHGDLLDNRRAALRDVFTFIGADPSFWDPDFERLWHTASGEQPELPLDTRAQLVEHFADDAARLRDFSGQAFPEWGV